jgi:hypothetical protein
MPQRTAPIRNFFSWSVLFLLIISLHTTFAGAQNLAFTPGTVSLYAGDPTLKLPTSAPNYTGPISGLVLFGPTNMVSDKNGNMYVIDSRDYVVRVIAASSNPIPALPGVTVQAGYVYPIAGNGSEQNGTSSNPGTTPPCSGGTDPFGDGCAATQAFTYGATGIAVDSNGNIYIPSAATNQIRVVYGGGTVAGLGVTNPQPGYIYAVTNVAAVQNVNGNPGADSANGTPAASSVTYVPNTIAVDALGNIFFADGYVGNGATAVRVIYSAGNLPYLPSGATAGSLYTIGSGQQCSSLETNCGLGGPASGITFIRNIFGVAVDSNDNLYVGIGGSNAQVLGLYTGGTMPGITNPQPGYVYSVAGVGRFGGSNFPASGSVAASTNINLSNAGQAGQLTVNEGNLYIAAGDSLLKVDQTGILYNVLGGTSGCVAPADAYFDGCGTGSVSNGFFSGVVIDSTGNLYAANYAGGNGSQSLLQKVTVGSSLLDLATISGIPNSTSVYVTNSGSAALQLSGISFTGPFSQLSTGNSDCTSATSLAPSATCLIAVSSNPPSAGSSSGNLVVSSNALNATSSNNTVTINATAAKASSTTSLAASPTYPMVTSPGQTVTFTATVVPQYQDTLTATGTVAFISGYTGAGTGTTLSTIPVNGQGVATFTTSSLAAGAYPVTAVYSGDGNLTASSSSLALVNVSATPAAQVSLTASSSAINSGQSITLTANVTPNSGTDIPTGTVTFQDGGNPLPNSTVTLSGGVATLTTTTLPAGINQLVALYGGDTNFAANASANVSVAVTPAGQLQFQPGTIKLVAGNYFNAGTVTSGTPATSALFNNPISVAADSYGNTYIADGNNGGNNEVYVVASGNGPIPGMVSPTPGYIYTLGTGANCTSTSALPACGDGGSINQASFNGPTVVAVDALNNVYVNDNAVIRKISATTGTINTVAGVQSAGVGYSGDGGPATSAKINATAMAVDANGNIYFADKQDLLVRRIDGQTGVITSVAGTVAGAGTTVGGFPPNVCTAAPCGDGGPALSAAFVGPLGIAVDSANNLYVADYGTINRAANFNAVRKIDGKTGVISTVAGGYTNASCGNNVQGCGNGGPATSAMFWEINGVSVDNAGDLYITDLNTAEIREVNAQTGIINTVVGTVKGDDDFGNECGAAPCGDGGPATSAELVVPLMSALDAQGNLYVLEGGANTWGGEGVVREVPAGTLALSYGSQDLGTATPQTVAVTNIGLQPLVLSGLSIPAPNYEQQVSDGADCTADTSLSSGSSCQLDIAFFPTVTGSLPATATISSNSTNATSGQNTIALTGIGTGFGGTTTQTITFQSIPNGLSYGSAAILLTATSDSGQPVTFEAIGPASVSGSTLTITGAGTVTVTAYQFGNSQYAAAKPVSQSFTVAPATLTIAAPQTESITAGTPLAAPGYTITGFVKPDTQATTTTGAPVLTVADSTGKTYPVGSTPLSGTYTIEIQQGTLALTGAAAANYKLVFTNGTLTVTGTTPQTITFASLSNVTYGASTTSLAATSSSGLQVIYSVQGPANVVGNLLTITGTGPVAVTALQAGNSVYAAAAPVVQAFNVNKAVLSVAAVNTSVAQGAPLPTLAYTVTGFVDGDTQAVVSGSPLLTTTATSDSPIGQYPITVAVGTLSAANYTFNPVLGGTLTIVTPQSQTINFPAIANVTYGATPVTLAATSSSGLAVSYSVTGPATLSGATLIINGTGTVAVTANQAGNAVYGPASSAMQHFSVIPAVVTVTAGNATRQDNTPNPPFTYSYSGFVNNDTQGAALSGTPAVSSTATITSPVGTYPITIAAGTLNSTNYSFSFVPGILTITSGGPVSDFSIIATPQSITVEQGQIAQAVITLTPVNFYQGLVKFSCGNLPANVTCTFSPSTLAADGSNAPMTNALTINTNTASPVVGQFLPMKPTQVRSASFLFLPAGLAGLLMAFRRKQLAKHMKLHQWLVLLVLLAGAAGLTACGGSTSSSNSTLAAPGSNVITLTAADSAGGPSHTINIAINVQ